MNVKDRIEIPVGCLSSLLKSHRWGAARGGVEAAAGELGLSVLSVRAVQLLQAATQAAGSGGQVVRMLGAAALRGVGVGMRISQASTSVCMFLFVLYYLLAAEVRFTSTLPV